MMREAAEVLSVLRKRYAPPEWAFIEEVGDKTGAYRHRSADAVAMNLWPSRGLEILGFEIKVRRADWLNELKNPAKSAPVQQYCDRWWIVTGGRDVVRVEELPPTWGLLSIASGRLVCVQDAPKLEAQPPDRGFVASVLRRSYESISGSKESDERYAQGKVDGIAAGREMAQRQFDRSQEDMRRLQASVRRFEEVSGLTINDYNGERLGELVSVAQLLRRKSVDIGDALQQAKRPLETALRTIEALESLQRVQAGAVVLPSATP